MDTEFKEHLCRLLTRFRAKAAMRDSKHYVILRLVLDPTLPRREVSESPSPESRQDERSLQRPPLEVQELALTPDAATKLGQALLRLGKATSGSVH